jgi:uncharacterized protein involved in type VI secretion and phage assembly
MKCWSRSSTAIPSSPYIVGVLWNKTDKPPAGSGEILSMRRCKVNQRIVRSRSGHTIILDDTSGKEQIIIQDKTAKEQHCDQFERQLNDDQNRRRFHDTGRRQVHRKSKSDIHAQVAGQRRYRSHIVDGSKRR